MGVDDTAARPGGAKKPGAWATDTAAVGGRLAVAGMLRLAAACLAGLLADPALAADQCDLRNRSSLEPIDATAFFSLPQGEIAIGERCSMHNRNMCEAYFPITDCDVVWYATDPDSGADRPVSVTVNTSSWCKECEPSRSTYLEASYTLVSNGKQAESINLHRNETLAFGKGWEPRGNRSYRRGCCEKILEGDTIDAFLRYHDSEVTLHDEFERDVVRFWHSFFNRGGGELIETWNERKFFARAVLGEGLCDGGCTLKAYLVKFEETENASPSKAVRVSGKTRNFDLLVVATSAPQTKRLYDHRKIIHLFHTVVEPSAN